MNKNTRDDGMLASSAGVPEDSNAAVVCDLSAIPADQRASHIELARALLFREGRAVQQIDNGFMVRLPLECLVDAAKFVDNERRCCRHLAFALDVPTNGAAMTLRVTGPLAWEELQALQLVTPTERAAST